MNVRKKFKPTKNKGLKLRYIIVVFFISVGTLLGMMIHYGLDWSLLSSLSFYEDLANPSVRVIRVGEGLRKEEVADILVNKFGWNDAQRSDFLNAHLAYAKESFEGQYFPKTYLLHKDSDPVVVSKTMTDEYRKEVATAKKTKSAKIINENTALIVASLIQREAAGKSDMRLISGIIWNRIFKGMKLQIDATLQYAKGDESLWWPQINPQDKKIDSPFNTYIYAMPPTPISNPGLSAIEAAYNPASTNCLFYLHDKNKNIHCASTYAQHLKNIQRYL